MLSNFESAVKIHLMSEEIALNGGYESRFIPVGSAMNGLPPNIRERVSSLGVLIAALTYSADGSYNIRYDTPLGGIANAIRMRTERSTEEQRRLLWPQFLEDLLTLSDRQFLVNWYEELAGQPTPLSIGATTYIWPGRLIGFKNRERNI